jgi:hypothetical protein
LPHSGISGSTPACGSPKLIAANHALHRFLAPRHPPCALSSLTIKPLPTNGLQVEGQGSVQEPWRSRPHVGPTRPTRGILPPRRFKNSRLRCDRSSTIASTFHYSVFKVREVPRRGVGIIAISQLASTTSHRHDALSSSGGGNGTRTHDPRLAKPMLYQLSYSPMPSRGTAA